MCICSTLRVTLLWNYCQNIRPTMHNTWTNIFVYKRITWIYTKIVAPQCFDFIFITSVKLRGNWLSPCSTLPYNIIVHMCMHIVYKLGVLYVTAACMIKHVHTRVSHAYLFPLFFFSWFLLVTKPRHTRVK